MQSIFLNCSINYENAEELYNKTRFSIADKIIEFWGNYNTKLRFDNVPVFLSLPIFFNDKELYGGTLKIFVDSFDKYDIEAIYDSNKDEIDKAATELVKNLSEKLSEIVIPVNNLDNVIYDEATDAFYVKIGCEQPDTIMLSCGLEKEE